MAHWKSHRQRLCDEKTSFSHHKGNLHKHRTGKESLTSLHLALAACSSLLEHCCFAAAWRREQLQHSEAVPSLTSRGWSVAMAAAWECCTDFHGNGHSCSRKRRPKSHDYTARTIGCTKPLHGSEGKGEIACAAGSATMASISVQHRAGLCAIPTSSQPVAGCHQSPPESPLLAGQSCAEQPPGAAARWKEAVSAGFPQARPAAKQQTDTQLH